MNKTLCSEKDSLGTKLRSEGSNLGALCTEGDSLEIQYIELQSLLVQRKYLENTIIYIIYICYSLTYLNLLSAYDKP